MLQGKVWGTTRLLLSTPFVEAHWIEVLPTSYCSRHKHVGKWNAFIVVAGTLYVRSFTDLSDVTKLRPGDIMLAKPGLEHRFFTLNTPATALELYYPASLSEDIVRADLGGRGRLNE